MVALCLVGVPAFERTEDPQPPARDVVDGDEYFALELTSPADSARASPTRRTVGVARWTRRAGPSTLLEFEARFFDEQARVHHVERIDEGGSELVWREWRAGQGRTLRARLANGALELVEWGGLQVHRESSQAPRDLVFPLQAVELARARANCGERAFPRFDPLGRCVELTTLTRTREGELERAAFVDPEGVSVGTFAFEAGVLRWFQFQSGDLRARAVDVDEHARLARAYESSRAER